VDEVMSLRCFGWRALGQSMHCETHVVLFFFSSRRRHTRSYGDWSSDVCSSDLTQARVLRRVLEKIDHLDELRFGLFDPRHIGEGHAALANCRLVIALGLAFAQAENATTHLSGCFPRQPQETADEQQCRAEAEQNCDEWVGGLI